ncbi:hypothetical protein BU15DRAFT_69249, partial [Melanogaster broomeanus]
MHMPNPAKMSLLHPHAFAPGRLADSDGLSDAFATLKSCLEGSDARLNSTVQDLCSVPHLFEFIISGPVTNKRPVWPSAATLVARILHAYPSNPALIYNSSASALLVHLSSVLFALPPHLFSTDVLRDIGQYKVYIDNAIPVLSLLLSSDFATPVTGPHALVAEDDEEEVSRFFVSGKKQNKYRRKNKNEHGPVIDVAPFHRLQEQVPSSAEAATQMASRIADNLKVILQYYLDLLLDPILAQPFSDAYLLAVDEEAVRASQQEHAKVATEVIETKSSAYPKVQPIKAALYFDNADGFGNWRILIGTDATKELRRLTKSDRKKAGIVVKKI